MNKSRMLRLAKYLEQIKPETFDMHFYIDSRAPDYSTSACVAGHAMLMSGMKFDNYLRKCFDAKGNKILYFDIGRLAQEYLGLTSDQAHYLFYDNMDFTNKEAAEFIRSMVKNDKESN